MVNDMIHSALITPGYLYNSDPTMHVIDGRLWLFATQDPFSEKFTIPSQWSQMCHYHALSTDDFQTWVDHGAIFNIGDMSWAAGRSIWDGDAGIAANGKFYAYAPIKLTVDQDFVMAVMVADHPAGPYRDALGKPLLTRELLRDDFNTHVKHGLGLVSPTVIFDQGVPFLVFGWGEVYVARLKPNMIELAEAPIRVETHKELVESPVITNINGTYYLTCSNGGLWGTGGYPPPRIVYATSNQLTGPYLGATKILQEAQVNPEGAGYNHKYASSAHQFFAYYNGQWIFAYHRDSKVGGGTHRQICVTKLDVQPDGTLGVIDPNTDPGMIRRYPRLLLDAFAPNKREAEEFHEREGADEEPGFRQADYHFKMKPGGYLRYNQMDFGVGAGSYRIGVSCENAAVQNAVIEIRLDAADGECIGDASVKPTGGKLDYEVLTGPTRKVGGIHDLHLVARGGGAGAQGHMFNINWFTFERIHGWNDHPSDVARSSKG